MMTITKPQQTTRVVCEECQWKGEISERLAARNPFDLSEEISGCPNCKSINSFRTTCDEPECWEQDTMGIGTADGYRRTCWKHRPKEWDK